MSTLSGFEPTSSHVHLGFWTNWSQGRTMGATLTLTRSNGNLLVAFLAIFVGGTGRSFWRLGCFAFHHLFSSSMPEDGLYHQRQAILRNSDTAEDGAWRLIHSFLAWRRLGLRPAMRLLPILLFAIMTACSFGVASIFSSHVTSDTNNEVLLAGKNCSLFEPTDYTTHITEAILNPFLAQSASAYLNQVLKCYTGTGRRGDGCNLYVQPQLPLTVTANASCPFNSSMCKSQSENIVLDTGYIDSNDHLGINSPQGDRIQTRLVFSCAPLVTENFYEFVNDTTDGPRMRYFYGPSMFSTRLVPNGTNWTFEYPLNTHFPNDTASSNLPRQEYTLSPQYAWDKDDFNSGFEPIEQLRRPDVELSLFFLSSNNIAYAEPVDDPWFAAHKEARTAGVYVQDEPVRVLGCASQVQYCDANTQNRRCEPLRSVYANVTESISKVWTSQRQRDLVISFDRIFSATRMGILEIVASIGAAALRARYSLQYTISGPLPPDQWQLELEYWAKGMLASLQASVVTFVNGAPIKELEPYMYMPKKNDTGLNYMCHRQKIVTAAFSSFSVFGMAMILLVGGIIMLLDLTMEPFTFWLQRRNFSKLYTSSQDWREKSLRFPAEHGTHPLYASLEWTATSTLQLQRLAHEALGYGQWSKSADENPVTRTGERLAVLDVGNVKHPALERIGAGDVARAGTAWSEAKSSTTVKERFKGEKRDD
ncbi:hypothetical protein EJ04DRAFT_466936 [Polyplosphaeria fusca]|uniref:Uncharacterized protein n=1 Tax=Polyplosphaeria fusca TaxID=682080 RepID=A0A9P4R022_9PLEO|nr:hypothetical protein EJ04DRAFT_466936 [Polyplosphaeria fusca]